MFCRSRSASTSVSPAAVRNRTGSPLATEFLLIVTSLVPFVAVIAPAVSVPDWRTRTCSPFAEKTPAKLEVPVPSSIDASAVASFAIKMSNELVAFSDVSPATVIV